jgi:hypothetical protein
VKKRRFTEQQIIGFLKEAEAGDGGAGRLLSFVCYRKADFAAGLSDRATLALNG